MEPRGGGKFASGDLEVRNEISASRLVAGALPVFALANRRRAEDLLPPSSEPS